MPNTGHITLCPYYVNEREKTISCEDVGRRFRSKHERMVYMEQYCDKDYMQCKYAQALDKLYEVMEEKGDDKMLEFFRQRNRAARVELKRTVAQLGRQEAKADKQAEQIKELIAENNALKENIERVREKNKEMFGKWQNEKATFRNREEKMLQEMLAQALIYEGYFAYLMENSGVELFNLDEFHKWTECHEYKVEGDNEGNNFKVKVKEITDGNNRPSTEVSAAGDGETEQAEETTEGSGEETE